MKYAWKDLNNDNWGSYMFDTEEECIKDARENGIENCIHMEEVVPFNVLCQWMKETRQFPYYYEVIDETIKVVQL